MLRLRTYNSSLPGGYPYKQPQTGCEFDGNTPWRAQLRLIRKHRLGNKLPRTELDEVADDLEAYQCARLPKLCVNDTKQVVPTFAQSRGTAPRKCGSCGGRRKQQ